MVINTFVSLSSRALLASHLLPQRSGIHNGVRSLPPLSSRKSVRVRASSVDGDRSQPSSSKGRNPVALVLDIPRTIWRRWLNPLSDFGFGRRSIWDGWRRDVHRFRSSASCSHSGLVERVPIEVAIPEVPSGIRVLSDICGISLGTPVRIRGVTVGTVVHVNSSLKSVDAVVDVHTRL